jgi:hypothetical protein
MSDSHPIPPSLLSLHPNLGPRSRSNSTYTAWATAQAIADNLDLHHPAYRRMFNALPRATRDAATDMWFEGFRRTGGNRQGQQ